MGSAKLRLRRLDGFALLAILLVAAILRMGFVGVAEYRKDEADLTALTLDLRQGKSFPLLGIPSSISLPNSPVTVYLLLPPFLLSQNPLVAVVYIGILNVIGVGLLWLIAYRYLGRLVAFVAGLAYAVNPWAVMYSRKIWAQDYHTPIILLALFLGLYGFIEAKRWAQIVCLPILLVGLQMHFAAWSLVPLYVWLLWYGRKNTTGRTLALSSLLSLVVMMPYMLGILQTRGQLQALLPTRWNPDVVTQPIQQIAYLTNGLQLEGTFARYQAANFLAQVPQPPLLWSISGFFVLVGVVALWWRAPRYLAFLLTLWAFLTVAFLTFVAATGRFTGLWFESWPHYYIPSIPAICLLIGIGVTAIIKWRPSRNILRIPIGALAAAIIISQFAAVVGLLRYVDTHVTTSGFSFGTPLHDLLAVREALQPYNDILILNGDGRDLPSTGAPIWRSLLRDRDRCIRDLTLPTNALVYPSGPFAALFLPTQSGLDLSLYKAIYQVGSPTLVSLLPGEPPAQIYTPSNPHRINASITPLVPTQFTNGLTLTGYHLVGNQLTLRWMLPTPSRYDDVVVISYLNSQGKVLGQKRDPFWPSNNWCTNDTLISWVTLNLPKASDHLEVSLEVRYGDHHAIIATNEEMSVRIPLS